MAIITISRQIGSLGDEIAKVVADELDCECIEKTKISAVLSDYGFLAHEIEKYDEKKPSIWQSLTMQKKKFAHLIRGAIYELAAKENVVIVGRGGQAIFNAFPGILHVRIIAPYATRISRLMEQLGCDKKNAEQMILQSDRDSSGYISAYFDTDWDDKDLYDLVINTRRISLDNGVAMITRAVSAGEFKKRPQAFEQFRDLALTQKVELVLMEYPGLEVSNLGVDKGVVNLSGVAKLSAKQECEEAISNIKGVTKVINNLEVIPLAGI